MPHEPHALAQQPLPLLGVQVIGTRSISANHAVPGHGAAVVSQHSTNHPGRPAADVLSHIAVRHYPAGWDQLDAGEDALRQ